MDESTILKLAPHILKRFEQNLDDGVLFLYNVNTNEFWSGNNSSFYVIRLLNGERTLKEVYNELLPLFADYDYKDIKESFDSLLSNLVKKKFVEVVSENVRL